MLLSVDRYLSTLLSFVPNGKKGRMGGDFACLIHVPAKGPERVYTLSLNSPKPVLTSALYKETVWEFFGESGDGNESPVEASPRVDVIRAEVDPNHPVFNYIAPDALSECESHSDGCAGLDYYMLIWNVEGVGRTIECWEPYGRRDLDWITMIGAFQALSGQFEYALENSDRVAV